MTSTEEKEAPRGLHQWGLKIEFALDQGVGCAL